jgi:uncharacterized RDD family membrane protein YckC
VLPKKSSSDISHKADCFQCGKSFDVNNMLRYEGQWICLACKPDFFQKLKEGLSLPGRYQYGGFWIRFVAKVLDSFILSTLSFVFMLFFVLFEYVTSPAGKDISSFELQPGIIASIGELIITLGYTVFFVGKYGATPGKIICHLKIITAEGRRVSYARASARFFAEMISSLLAGFGYLMAIFNNEKKTLHDVICNTRVISDS